MTESATVIGVAVVYHERRVLVGTRGANLDLAGHAEFPGGQCEGHESPSEAAVRECREETGMDVVAIRLLDERRHLYLHGYVHIHFWLCAPRDIDRCEPERGFRWTPLNALDQLNFPAANRRVVTLLLESSDDQLNNS
ncbi:MAG: NUDIX domain-containing protein [Planctomycetaceae bacterium]